MQIKSATIVDGKLTLEMPIQDAQRFVYGFSEGEYDITRKKKKRSLDANAYYHVLVGKLAKALGYSTNRIHNLTLRKYGQLENIGGQLVYVMIPDTDEAEEKALEAETYHIKPTSSTKQGKNGTFRAYLLMRGSHTFSKDEFQTLIRGIQSDCADVGIEVLTPEELAGLEYDRQ